MECVKRGSPEQVEQLEVEYVPQRAFMRRFELDFSDSSSDDESNKNLDSEKERVEKKIEIVDLKAIASRPEVVKECDTHAKDPKLLVHLKSYRNTIPVPRHWCENGESLQGKLGVKRPYQLPDFLASSKIEAMRQAYLEKENMQDVGVKRPKMGMMDIDYRVLHDAFFKYQTKPKLTSYGDLYDEEKEFEASQGTEKMMKPGSLSQKDGPGMLNSAIQQEDQPNYEDQDQEQVEKAKRWGDLEGEEEEEEDAGRKTKV